MIYRVIFTTLLAMSSAAAQTVDTAAIEAMLEKLVVDSGKKDVAACEQGRSFTANYKQDMPQDFDYCQPQRQDSLLSQGLYASVDGMVKVLPQQHQDLQISAKVTVPLPEKEAAPINTQAPFVIELGEPTPDSATRVVSSTPTNNTNANTTLPAPVTRLQPIASSPTTIAAGCHDVQTVAHRGSHLLPENSIEAVVHALHSGHNGVEIDVQRLRNGSWVVHHDLRTGRVTHGQSGWVTAMDSKQWQKVRLIDRLGIKTEIQAPYLTNVLDAFMQNAISTQFLNIEIKSSAQQYSCNALASLDALVRKHMHSFEFIYSSRNVEDLYCLRSINPNVYLGLVIDPHPHSVELAPSSLSGKVAEWYNKHNGPQKTLQAYQENSNRAFLARTVFDDLRSLIGPYYGLHIDYLDYQTFSPRYANVGGRLMLYHLDANGGLASLLEQIRQRQEKLPDAVLIDDSPQALCSTGGVHG